MITVGDLKDVNEQVTMDVPKVDVDTCIECGKGDPVKKVKAGKEWILVSAKVDKEFFRSGEIVHIEKWLG